MRLAITGAAGFVGQAVVRHMVRYHPEVQLLLADRAFTTPQHFPTLTGDLADPAVIRTLCDDRVDVLLHLAALPGGAAQRDPMASRRINLDIPLSLIAAMAGRRLVIAGSIAVFGGELPPQVDDTTPPSPASIYGAHKHDVERAFAEAAGCDGMIVRLPGIVARPADAGGFGSAFLSDIFHAALAGAQYRVPVAPNATSWLMSAPVCAENLVKAALGKGTEREALTLPALRIPIGDLVAELGAHGDISGMRFEEDAMTRATFGSYPEIATPRANALGFRHDGTLAQLVETVLETI